MNANKSTSKSADRAALVRDLVAATGMTRFGVYKALREKRAPQNALVREAWIKALASAKAKLAKGKA